MWPVSGRGRVVRFGVVGMAGAFSLVERLRTWLVGVPQIGILCFKQSENLVHSGNTWRSVSSRSVALMPEC